MSWKLLPDSVAVDIAARILNTEGTEGTEETNFSGLSSARMACRAWHGSMMPQPGCVKRIVLPKVKWQCPLLESDRDFDEFLKWALDIAGEGAESLETGRSGYRLTNAGLKHLADSRIARSLISLDISDSDITDTGLELLSSLANLASLKIDILNPGKTDIGKLRAIPHLVSLSFGCHTIISDRDLPKLPIQLRSLALPEYEELTEPRITDMGLEMLPRGLTSLDISDIEYVTNEGIRSLPRLLPGLTYLRLGHCSVGITEDAIASLTALKSLELLDIRDIGFPIFEEAITELTGRFKVLYTEYWTF